MDEDMNLESVEAALSLPQNQPAGASSLAPQATPANPTDAGTTPATSPTTPGGPLSNMFNRAMKTVRQAIATQGNVTGAIRPNGQDGDAISRIVASLRGTSAALAQDGQPTTAVSSQTPPGAPTAPAPVAHMPQIKMVPSGGGRTTPAYEYGGNTILIDSGIDMNDQAAVQKFMTDTNNLIDMMNSAYEEV